MCSDRTTCSSCVPGKYGVVCDKVFIDTCSDGTCNKDSGRCDTGNKGMFMYLIIS